MTTPKYIPCSFDRGDYMEVAKQFENIDVNDFVSELTECSDDPFDLAAELAYSRYLLAKYEDAIGKLLMYIYPEKWRMKENN